MDDSAGSEKGLKSAISVSVLRNDIIFINSFVQVCGRNSVSVCAAQALAQMDKDITSH